MEMSPFLAAPQEGGKHASIESQQGVVSKYMKENYDEIKVRVEKGQKIIKAHAEARGESVNGFIGRAIDETMEDGTTPLVVKYTEERIAGGVRPPPLNVAFTTV